jgi:hypothetical protein
MTSYPPYPMLPPCPQGGHVEVVELLIRRGADVNARDYWGNTPLMLAAKNGRREVVRTLMSLGVDAGAGNLRGETAVHVAQNDLTRGLVLKVRGRFALTGTEGPRRECRGAPRDSVRRLVSAWRRR